MGSAEGVGPLVLLVVLVIAVVAVVLVVRSAQASGRPGGARPSLRPPQVPRRPTSGRPVAPDDDPEFLRELERRAKRDDGSPSA